MRRRFPLGEVAAGSSGRAGGVRSMRRLLTGSGGRGGLRGSVFRGVFEGGVSRFHAVGEIVRCSMLAGDALGSCSPRAGGFPLCSRIPSGVGGGG